MIDLIENKLREHLALCLPDHHFQAVLDYALFPPGKLFRPQLVWNLAQDLGGITDNHQILASAIEIHHAYTLVHDDLPSMDNDDIRRGKESTHKKFNDWMAILAGDALLNFSYELLGYIESPHLSRLIKLFGEMTGSRGLILGQVMDLEHRQKELKEIILIHQLKTSRLIQLALEGCNILSESRIPSEMTMKLGESLGIVFQLLDDISELAKPLGTHEREINPFVKFNSHEVTKILTIHIHQMDQILQKENLFHLMRLVKGYLQNTQSYLLKSKVDIKTKLPQIDEIISLL